jgi:hypothetical protein
MAMSSISRKEYLREVSKQYSLASKTSKGELLASAEAVTGMHRKSLIRRLGKPSHRSEHQSLVSRGPKVIYDSTFHDALLVCWHAENDICAERLQPFLAYLVPKLVACGELQCSPQTYELLLKVSTPW